MKRGAAIGLLLGACLMAAGCSGEGAATCQSEYGMHYVAATFAQTVSLARYTPMASGYVAATVNGDTSNMVAFGAPTITLASSSASVKVACRFVPMD